MSDSIYPIVQTGVSGIVAVSTAAAVTNTAKKAFGSKKKKGVPKF